MQSIFKSSLIVLLSITFFGCQRYESEKAETKAKQKVAKTPIAAEAACGQCKFGLKGEGCDLAVRIDGKAYYVVGASIDDFGDAHADDGLCMAVRKAKVEGEIKDGRFVATKFEVLPAEDKTKK